MDLTGADRLLHDVVDADGNVDYAEALAGKDLDEALRVIADANLDGLSDADRYAFLLNAYNLCTLDAVRRVLIPRERSLTHPLVWFRFFFLTPIKVAGRRMNLWALEFRLIKPYLRRDPRGHFALVCASCGCPPLRGGVFHGDALDDELDLAARAFLQPGGGYRVDEEGLHLSRIFKWYRKDFAAMGGPLAVWQRYADPEDVAAADSPPIQYLPYDWSLNVHRPKPN